MVNDQVHTMNFLYCHEDYREARRVGVPMVNASTSRTRISTGRASISDARLPDARQRGRGDEGEAAAADDPSVAKGLPEGVGVGDPDHSCARSSAGSRSASRGSISCSTRWRWCLRTPCSRAFGSSRARSCRSSARRTTPGRRCSRPPPSRLSAPSPRAHADAGRYRRCRCDRAGPGHRHDRALSHRHGRTLRRHVSADDAEMRKSAREAVLPPSLHPTIPPALSIQVWRVAESPWGAFHWALTRISCRSGVRCARFSRAPPS